MFLQVSGLGFRLDGLLEPQRCAVETHWPSLVREPLDDAMPVAIESIELSPKRGSASSAGRELELELEHGDGVTKLASDDFRGRFSWRGELEGTLETARSEPEYFRGILENFIRVVVAHRLVLSGGFLAHSAVVCHGGDAMLFVGPSGAGKSTVSKLAVAAGLRIASDDLNPVRFADGTFVAGGSPFIGELGDATAEALPLRAVYRLEKAERDAVRPLGRGAAVAALFASSPFVNRSPSLQDALLANIERVAAKVPAHVLSFRREGSFWPLVAVSEVA